MKTVYLVVITTFLGLSHKSNAEETARMLWEDRPVSAVHIIARARELEGLNAGKDAIETALRQSGFEYSIDPSGCPPKKGIYTVCFVSERTDAEYLTQARGLDKKLIEAVRDAHSWPSYPYVRNGVAAIVIGSTTLDTRIAFLPSLNRPFCEEDVAAMRLLLQRLNESDQFKHVKFQVTPSSTACASNE